MADKPTPGEFKTSLMGFQKAQVLAYIDELSAKALESQKQQEQAAEALRKELENAKADNDVLLEKTREVCDRLTSEEKRAGEAESRARAISEQLLHMEETANGYKSRLFTKEQLWLCSPVSAVFHNLGQLLVAAALMKTWAVLAYLPYLVIAGAASGLFTGLCAQFLIRRLDRIAPKT